MLLYEQLKTGGEKNKDFQYKIWSKSVERFSSYVWKSLSFNYLENLKT
jgi:hypothetical protein